MPTVLYSHLRGNDAAVFVTSLGLYRFQFCVFDKDVHQTFEKAVNELKTLATKKQFTSSISVPCFEYWLLLHFVDTDSPFQCAGKKSVGDQVVAQLRKKIPNYQKNTSVFELVREKTEHAIKHAKAFQKRATAEHENPSTTVHELVLALQALVSKKPS
jgi:hypothetical protein